MITQSFTLSACPAVERPPRCAGGSPQGIEQQSPRRGEQTYDHRVFPPAGARRSGRARWLPGAEVSAEVSRRLAREQHWDDLVRLRGRLRRAFHGRGQKPSHLGRGLGELLVADDREHLLAVDAGVWPCFRLTIRLHGGRTPSSGWASSAWWASGGLQAPRITDRSTSRAARWDVYLLVDRWPQATLPS